MGHDYGVFGVLAPERQRACCVRRERGRWWRFCDFPMCADRYMVGAELMQRD